MGSVFYREIDEDDARRLETESDKLEAWGELAAEQLYGEGDGWEWWQPGQDVILEFFADEACSLFLGETTVQLEYCPRFSVTASNRSRKALMQMLG